MCGCVKRHVGRSVTGEPTTPDLRSDASPPRRRLSGEQRRETLLDAAAVVVRGGDVDAVTMERVAEMVGVHKKVAYRFFGNRDDLLIALFSRENERLDQRVAQALEGCEQLESMLRAIVATYLGALESDELHIQNVAATGLGGAIAAYQEARAVAVIEWVADLIRSESDVGAHAAITGATVFIYGLDGLIQRSGHGEVDVRLLEDEFIAMALGALDGLLARRATSIRPEHGVARPARRRRVEGSPPT